MAFTPGSVHKAIVRIKNSGGAPTAVGGSASLTITPDGGTMDLSSLLAMPINPGVTVEAIRDFTIWTSATPGIQNTWNLIIHYDGKVLSLQGNAFVVVMSLEQALAAAGYQVIADPNYSWIKEVVLGGYTIPLSYVEEGGIAGWNDYLYALSQSGYTPEELRGITQAIKPLWDAMWVALRAAGYTG